MRALLLAAFEGDFSEEDWEHALGGWHVVLRVDELLVAHAAVVPRELHAGSAPLRVGYVEAVAAVPAGQGFGTAVMTEVNDLVRREFALGALSTGQHRFYERLGWERWKGRTYVRTQDGLVRTPEEDDGLTVLRFGGTADLDLTAPLSCEARSGDDW